MDDPREQRLAKLAQIEKLIEEREALIIELAVERKGERGYQTKLAKLSGLTRARVSQIVSRAAGRETREA